MCNCENILFCISFIMLEITYHWTIMTQYNKLCPQYNKLCPTGSHWTDMMEPLHDAVVSHMTRSLYSFRWITILILLILIQLIYHVQININKLCHDSNCVVFSTTSQLHTKINSINCYTYYQICHWQGHKRQGLQTCFPHTSYMHTHIIHIHTYKTI